MRKGLELSDVLLVPKPSNVNSRGSVDIKQEFKSLSGKKFTLDVPIIASPMKGIVGTELIKELGRLGGIGILPRFYNDVKDWVKDVMKLDVVGIPYGLSIGLDTESGNDIVNLITDGRIKNCKILCVDIANGYLESLWVYLEKISKRLPESVALMSGNVATNYGLYNLWLAGATMFRIGIGSGQLCTTRNKTGVGVPQFTAIQDCCNGNRGLVADGGLSTSGDIVKALAAGADFVMLGSMFAKVKESSNNGRIYGMASKELQEQFYSDVKSVEGVSKEVEKTMTLKELVDDISWSIKSACTYLNANNLDELRENAQFIQVGNGSIVEK